MLLFGGGEARAALSCGGPAYGIDKFYTPPANCDATSAGADGFVLNQTQSGSPGAWIVSLSLNNPTGSQRSFTCTSTTNGCGGSPSYSNPSFFSSISAACSTGTGDCTMTYTYTNGTGPVSVTYYIAAGTNYIASTSIAGGGFDGPSTRMLLGSSKSPSNVGDSVTLTTRLTGYGAVGIGSGNVDLSSSIDGALGSVALDTLGGVSAIAGGAYHNCTVTSAGGAKCWGANTYGSLGDGTTTNSSSPVDVAGLSSGVVAVTAGLNHTCALTSAGGVKCWGANYNGQVGDGTVTSRTAPVNVSGLTSGVVAISAGVEHTCALLNSGGIKCWGRNDGGQLGIGATGTQFTPVSVRVSLGGAEFSGVVAIAASYQHSCALTSAGGVKCWGSNNNGQLGDGTTTQRMVPGDVTGLTSGIATISTHNDSTCALTNTGGVKCWGLNGNSQIGDGTTTTRTTPVDVSGLTSGVVAISTGARHACALTSTAGMKCWGLNSNGQIGDTTTTQRTTPVDVSGLTGGVFAISTGDFHSCAVIGGATVKCWGYNALGQVGDGTLTQRNSPVSVPSLAVALMGKATLSTSALTRATHTMTASYDGDGAGTIFTPANATVSQQVVGSTTVTTAATSKSPATSGDSLTFTARVTALGGLPTGSVNFSSSLNGAIGAAALDVYGGDKSVVTGIHHSCALTPASGVKCWGANYDGQLGTTTGSGTTTAYPSPTDVAGVSGVVSLASGTRHTCALTSSGGVKCWGWNRYGQLGNSTNNGTDNPNPTPTDVTGVSGVAALAAGELHTCALLKNGGVKCWGYNYYGALGNSTGTGTSNAYPTPVDVAGLSGIVAVVADGGHTCALTNTGGVKCWELNQSGQLGNTAGNGTDTAFPVPTDVPGLSGVTALVAGNSHTCALSSAGAVSCWGYNFYGQLGNGTGTGTSSAYPTPTAVSGLSGVVALAAGGHYTCALSSAGTVSCWGVNRYGQLGNSTGTGTTNAYPTPTVVSGLSGALALAAGVNHTCALTNVAGIKCWGNNYYGQFASTVDNYTENAHPSPVDATGVSAAINAKATLSISSSALSLGAHTITASYVGDANHEASNGTVSQQVDAPPAPSVTSLSPSSGPVAGSTSVVITGTNFTGATSVTFGGDNATTFNVDSATQITATAPAHVAGDVGVVVTTSGGSTTPDAASTYAYVAAPVVTAVSPNAGPLGGGTTVVVTGTNLSGATAVTFGATPATGFTVNSATQIIATAPAGAGTVDVRVTTVGGTSATSAADQFTYVAAPVVTSISPTAGPAAGATSVTITGTNLSGATAVTFGASAATGFTVNSATSITATAPAGTGVVDVRVTTVGGTSATSAADQFTYIPAPTLASVSPTSGPTVGGTSVVISGTNFSGASAVTFDGIAAAGYTVDSATQITAISPSHAAGVVDVAVTTTGGAVTSTGAFTYQLSPTALLVGTAKTPIYQTQPATFTARLTALGGGAPTGNVNFSSSISGAIGSAALDVFGGSAIAQGDAHTCILTDAGGVKCSGDNSFGQLGDGTTTRRLSPVDVSGLSGGVVAIASGLYHSCALTSSGGVKCWGYNDYGQLGDGTTTGKTSPVNVSGLSSGVVAIATNGSHSCALKSSGGVKCWGYNGYGQLGDGTVTQRSTPVDVVVSPGGAALDGVVSIANGRDHTCVLTTSGGMKCWGYNVDGEIGDGTTANRSSPTNVSGLSSGIAKIFVGYFNSCAITTSGAAKCWGLNDNRQLGDGTTTNRATPVDVSGLGSGVVSLANGYLHGCALLTGGGMKCWGDNGYGQLGDGTSTSRATPVDVSGLTSGVASISAGSLFNCAVLNAGGVKCWGAGDSGQLGNGGTSHRSTPTDVPGMTAAFLARATLATSSLSAGAHTITAAYAGDGNHATSNTTVAQDVIGLPSVMAINPTAGPTGGGTSVVITGTNLSGASAVTFGASAASGFTVNSATQITATSPAHSAGTVDVVVTTPAGASAFSAADQFTYVAAPAVTSISPTAGPTAGGTSVVITGTSLSGASAVMFGAWSALSFSVNSDTQITALAPSGAGTVDVRVTTVGGTSATSAADQFTYIPTPTVASVSPSAGPTSGGASVVITGTNFTGASSVTFDGIAATAFTVTSATSINATTPAHAAGAVDVVVTTVGGSGTGTAAYTYVVAPTVASVSPSAGPTAGGTSVTITGTNLTGASSVTFGGLAATSVTAVNATTITATTPAHAAGAVNVAVTTPGGLGTGVGIYTYAAAPTLASVTPSTGPISGGTSVTITGTNLIGTSSVTFGGLAATSVTAVNATTVTAVTPAHAAGAVNVAVVTPGGSASNTGAFTYTNGTLQVTPASDMIALGAQAGPFDPSSFSYQFKSSAGTVNWSVSGVPDWLTVSPGTSGSADSSSGTTVTFSVNTAATTKPVGTHGPATVTITNTDNGQGNTTRRAGLTVSPQACEVVARGPLFNGDAKGDILWRSDSGAIGMWFMNGTSLISGPGLGTISTDWRLIGAADFNGDGKSDLLWRNTTTGQVAVWFISGVTVTGTASLGTVTSDWHIVGAADVDGDNVADILWRHDSGTLALWHGTGGTGQGRAVIGSIDMSWRIAGFVDFDGDGKADILWRNTSGVVAVWLMNGDVIKSSAGFGNVPSDWRIRGIGDFNGDGKADILWRQDSGTVAMWFMNGTALSSAAIVGTISGDWHIATTNDYDGDGKTDILWRQDSGTLGIWLMNGATMTSAGGVAGVAYDWHLVNGEHDRPPVLIQPGPC